MPYREMLGEEKAVPAKSEKANAEMAKVVPSNAEPQTFESGERTGAGGLTWPNARTVSFGTCSCALGRPLVERLSGFTVGHGHEV